MEGAQSLRRCDPTSDRAVARSLAIPLAPVLPFNAEVWTFVGQAMSRLPALN